MTRVRATIWAMSGAMFCFASLNWTTHSCSVLSLPDAFLPAGTQMQSSKARKHDALSEAASMNIVLAVDKIFATVHYPSHAMLMQDTAAQR